MLKYTICKISTGDFRIVPINWFTKNNTTFQWPPYEDTNEVNTAISNMYEPESDWNEEKVNKIMMTKDDYSSAKDILGIIKVVSDKELSELDETKLKKSRSKRHKKKYSTDDTSSNDENDNTQTSKKLKKGFCDKFPLKPINFQPFLKCTKTKNKSSGTIKAQINTEKELTDSEFGSSSLTSPANCNDQSSSTVYEKSRELLKSASFQSSPKCTKSKSPVYEKSLSNVDVTHPINSKIEIILTSLVEYSKEIINKANKLTNSIEDLDKRLQILENILNTGRGKLTNENNSITDDIEEYIPLKTLDKFNEFDNKLNDQKYLRQVAKYMKSIGGSETHELVLNILKRFMTNQLSTCFNIQGKNLKKKDEAQPKIAFKNTNLLKCIIRAAHLHRNNVDENNVIQKSIAPWLAQANLRLCREKIKKTKKEALQTRNDTTEDTTSEEDEEQTL